MQQDDHLIRQIGSAIGASECVAFAVERGPLNEEMTTLMHVRPDDAPEDVRSAAIAAFREIVRPCIEQSKDGVIEVDLPPAEGVKQFCLVTLARRDDAVVGAAAFIVQCRDQHEATIALMRAQRVASGI